MMATFEEIADTFQSVEPDFRLELLLDYAEKLPPLPERYHALRDEGLGMVHECQSPVFLQVEVEDDTVHLYADVPREAPTARAFVAILHEAFDEQPTTVVHDAPDDVLRQLGLRTMLGARRTRGLSAIYQQFRGEVKNEGRLPEASAE